MLAVITGDIINSKEEKPKNWLKALKGVLGKYGKEPKSWEIYRGDSFQLEIAQAEESLMAALKIKSIIKLEKTLDVRMGIGIGNKTYAAKKITESNGEAFINSGEAFEKLKKNTLYIKSPWKEIDRQLNLYFELSSLIMDSWTVGSAEIVSLSLDFPEATQQELSEKLGITQGRISERMKRAGFDEIMKMEKRFRELILKNTQ